jgi:hypothetical protein
MAEFSGALFIADDSETTDVTDHVDDASQENVAYQDARRKRAVVKQERLHQALAKVVDDYVFLNCVTIDITSAESVGRLLAKIDKCNVYVFTECHPPERPTLCTKICSIAPFNPKMWTDTKRWQTFDRESHRRFHSLCWKPTSSGKTHHLQCMNVFYRVTTNKRPMKSSPTSIRNEIEVPVRTSTT